MALTVVLESQVSTIMTLSKLTMWLERGRNLASMHRGRWLAIAYEKRTSALAPGGTAKTWTPRHWGLCQVHCVLIYYQS